MNLVAVDRDVMVSYDLDRFRYFGFCGIVFLFFRLGLRDADHNTKDD